MIIFKETYCPKCKTTHNFASQHTLSGLYWECINYKVWYKDEDLTDAFLSLSKDPEYKQKGVSMETKITKLPINRNLTLPTDSEERKSYPILSGCLKYFAAALSSVARTSKLGNDKHNPGQPLHHARGKSMDHGDCIIRHLMDVEDMLAARSRAEALGHDKPFTDRQVLDEVGSLAWRALAYSQELHERLGAAPLAPAAKEG